MKQLITLTLLLLSFLMTNAQTQMGSDLDGEASYDESGTSIAVSQNGKRIAIGARNNDGNGTNAGHTRAVYNEGNSPELGHVSVYSVFNCSNPIVDSYPYTEDFDFLNSYDISLFSCVTIDNMSECWVNDASNINNWTARFAPTSSAGTGPSNDHTTGSGNYVFLEASSCSGPSYLNSPSFDISSLSDPYVEFYYHMFGADMGTLELEVFTNATGWNSVWSTTGDQGNMWLQAGVDLSVYSSSTVQLRFKGTVSMGATSDMAIDDVTVFNNPMSSVKSAETLHDLNVYPNPTDGLVTVELDLVTSTDLELQIITMLGKTVVSEQFGALSGNQTRVLDLSEFASGVYLVKVGDGQEASVKKLLLQH